MLYFCKIKSDFLKFEGSDRLDLINRLSTNEVNSLGKFNCIKTILTSDKGRFVDLITLYNFGDFVFSMCSGGNAKNVLNHLEKYTIMDDFKATDMTGTHEAVLFFGKDADNFAEDTFGSKPEKLENNDFSIFKRNDSLDTIAAKNDDGFGGIYFIYPVEDKNFWKEKLLAPKITDDVSRREYDLKEVSESEFEVLRIEKGIPGFGKEMSDLTNPLECGLNKYVSFTKGCYIGQEVIARLDAYDKINKHMVGIISAQEIPIAKITVDGKECGFTTSTAHSEKFGYLGLGFVKTIFLDTKKDYKIKSEDNLIDCKITELPFNLN